MGAPHAAATDRDPGHAPADRADAPQSRYAALLALIADVARRRGAGEHLPDAQVVAENGDLMPDLGERLAALRMIRRGMVAASAMPPGRGTAPADCVPVSQLDSPITSAEAEPDAVAPTQQPDAVGGIPDAARPSIPGYYLVREVCAGGQGAVYKAVQESTGRAVAVKVLPGGWIAGARHRARFEREAAILARLDHPHVVRIVDRGRTPGGAVYLVMDFVDGRPLDAFADACRDDGAAGVRRLLGVLADLAAAVGQAHMAGIVHRDLKPSNVLVDAAGQPRLLDFGLARETRPDLANLRAPTVTHTGQIVGSLPWASPEQADGRSAGAGPAADVYSLGVCAYAALTGRHPYALDGSYADVLGRIRTAAAAPVGRMPGVDREHLSRVLDRCLAKDPRDRYPTGAELAADLRALAERREPAAPRRQRRRAGRWLPLAAVVLLVGGLASWHVASGRPVRPPVTVFGLPAMTDGAGVRLVLVPKGSVGVGRSTDDPHARPGNRATRAVFFRPLWVGTHEVTRAQYAAVLDLPPAPPGEAELPVTGVTVAEAEEFCRRLSAREGAAYRLPTEAEWEYACRAGATGAWAGNGDPDDMGWHAGNAGGRPRPVARKGPNHWGIFDAHGNAAEWCAGAFDPARIDVRPAGPAGTTGAPAAAPADRRPVRGGSFARPAAESRSAARDSAAPDERRPDVGFRVVREP